MNFCLDNLVKGKNIDTESYKFTSTEEISLGGYVISEVKTRLDVILIASGAEVTLAAMPVPYEEAKRFGAFNIIFTLFTLLFIQFAENLKN